jgi:hypothetical protein
MKIALELKIMRGEEVEAGRSLAAESLSLLPIPVPNIGERIVFAAGGTLYRGTVTHKEIELIHIDDPDDGVLAVTVWATEEA